MTDDTDLVRAFCEAFSRRDTDELLEFFAEDAIYHNMPMPPVRGKDAIRGVLDMFLQPAVSVEFVILHIAEAHGVLLTERLDKFLIGGKQVEFPVAGVFEVAGGKINSWR
ncbi:MAG: limonene-1,2-epoxide hydrolase family protein, partial [Chloroflexota bacterium]